MDPKYQAQLHISLHNAPVALAIFVLVVVLSGFALTGVAALKRSKGSRRELP